VAAIQEGENGEEEVPAIDETVGLDIETTSETEAETEAEPASD
jgi:hypothetical protein